MTKLLDNAFEKISQLPEMEQNIFAKLILEEIDSEEKWNKSLSDSELLLEDLAKEALRDFNNNNTEELSIDKL